ncbi:MAG: exodeoxyribonuclease VII large subunit [Gammaproteobacteria bacterium]|jgi:exodeoxyribonuclease VII large subunit
MSPKSGTTDADNDINFNDIYSVSELNREVRSLIETRFPSIWVQGEISNVARPASGHIYFSLKDESAQVRCAMFRMSNRLLKFRPQDGMQVLVRASVSLYETRGDFQLIVSHMEEVGDGVLRRKFDQLKAALAQEGLFDAEHKQDIPAFPNRVGVITSPSGAAIRDVLSVFKRRAPEIPILIYPIPVQGDDAPPRIVHMIRKACRRRDCDVLILTRGGGSLEDLWAFNDEQVARAIFECDIPIVCGVGHEIDFTIADFVADVRAPTPSAAAELISPDRNTWLAHIERTQARLVQLITRTIANSRQQVDWLAKRIQHPRQRIQHMAQRLDEIEQRLVHVQKISRQSAAARLAALATRLEHRNPRHRLEKLAMTQQALTARLINAIQTKLQSSQHRVGSLSRALEAVSPLATLNRGYAIVKKRDDGTIVRDATQLKKGEQLVTRFQHGHALSTVDETGDS